jgi:DNA-directed RNA polymerase subunit L
MTTVKNIIESKHPVPKDTVALCKKLGVANKLPAATPRSVSFELHNSNMALANAIRRCGNSELDVIRLTADNDAFETDDPYIIPYELRRRINLIPVKQTLRMSASLNVTNRTDEITPIYSSQIVVDSKSTGALFSQTFILTVLRPGKTLHIKNIYPETGSVQSTGESSFSFEGRIGFKCIGIEKMISEGASSMNTTPTKCKLTIPRQKWIEPVMIVKMILDTLHKKVSGVKNMLEKSAGDLYNNEFEMTITDEHCSLNLINETYTLGNLLSWYGGEIEKNIPHISCDKAHPTDNFVTVTVRHKTPKEILKKATVAVLKDIERVQSAF